MTIIHHKVYPVCKITRGGKFNFLKLEISFANSHETPGNEPGFTTEDGDNTFINKRLLHFVLSFIEVQNSQHQLPPGIF